MNNMSPLPRCWMIGFRRQERPHTTTHPPPYQLVSRRPGTGILLALPGAIRSRQVAHIGTYALAERVDEGAHIAGYALPGSGESLAGARAECRFPDAATRVDKAAGVSLCAVSLDGENRSSSSGGRGDMLFTHALLSGR